MQDDDRSPARRDESSTSAQEQPVDLAIPVREHKTIDGDSLLDLMRGAASREAGSESIPRQSGGGPAAKSGLRVYFDAADIASLSNNLDSTFDRFSSAKADLEARVAERTQDLENTRQRLEVVIDSISDALISFDENGNIESFNRCAEQVFGYSEADVVGRPVSLLLPKFPQTKMLAGTFDEMSAQRENGFAFRVEGSLRPMQMHDRIIFVLMVRDLTSVKFTQKLLNEQAFLLGKSKSLAFTTNADYEIEWCNPCFEVLTGLAFEDIIGKNPLNSLLARGTPQATISEIAAAQARLAPYCVDVILKHSSGRPFWVELEAHPMLDEHGVLEKYVTLGVDITDRKRQEQQQADFVAMVSHELRTPLTVVSGSLDALEMSFSDALPDMGNSLIQMGQRNCASLSTLIEDLLDINKLEAGVIRFESELIDVAEPVRDAARTIRRLAVEAGLTFTTQIDAEPVNVFLDPNRLRQVVLNLLSNAVKFSQPGGEILLSIEDLGEKLKISVADNGLGIPAEFQPSVFERFSRDPAVQASGKEGFGLGLSISKGLIEQMGGSVLFESTEGVGSTFWIELPVAPPEAHARGESESDHLAMPEADDSISNEVAPA